ncbi:unnamed protein product [Trifolium pratense]|uniref:Uncharacterized protein n=1 Tax=Trifolium pratense TaxID=57577 RepID=A0ACB0LGE0_TRIPR|nr:unnamed protein product [Trifolium pratense]
MRTKLNSQIIISDPQAQEEASCWKWIKPPSQNIIAERSGEPKARSSNKATI